jgi:hypothetical protein
MDMIRTFTITAELAELAETFLWFCVFCVLGG